MKHEVIEKENIFVPGLIHHRRPSLDIMMNSLTAILQSQRANVYSGLLLAVLFAFFAYAHVSRFQETREWTLILAVISETLTAGFFMARSGPKTVSLNPSDWLVAIAGSFTPLFLRPGTWGLLPQAGIAIALGTVFQIAGLLSLNRSFALVAARREIKTTWMYRVVRHPLYASYLLVFGGYVLVHTTSANLLIYSITIVFLCMRIFREERHLALDQAYRRYMLDVRYRLIPRVF